MRPAFLCRPRPRATWVARNRQKGSVVPSAPHRVPPTRYRFPIAKMRLPPIRQGLRPVMFANDRHDSLSVNTRNTGKLSQPNQPLNTRSGDTVCSFRLRSV